MGAEDTTMTPTEDRAALAAKAARALAKSKGGRPKGTKVSAATRAKLRAAWKRRKATMAQTAKTPGRRRSGTPARREPRMTVAKHEALMAEAHQEDAQHIQELQHRLTAAQQTNTALGQALSKTQTRMYQLERYLLDKIVPDLPDLKG